MGGGGGDDGAGAAEADNDNAGGEGNNNDNNGNGNNNDDENSSEYDPFEDFDIGQCDTYENLWLWDLSLTCENEYSLDACECIFAEQLVEEERLSCYDMSSCPSDCQICRTCLKLLGCGGSGNANRVSAPMRRSLFVVLAAAGIIFLSGAYCVVWKGRQSSSELAAHLMLSDDTVSSNFLGTMFSGRTGPPKVWLAPVDASTQFKPSHKAAIEAFSDEGRNMFPVFSAAGRKSKQPLHEDDNVWLAPVP